MRCAREDPDIKMKLAWDVLVELPRLRKSSQHGMYKRNSPHKNEASTGCVREAPHIKMKPAWDVRETPQIKKRDLTKDV